MDIPIIDKDERDKRISEDYWKLIYTMSSTKISTTCKLVLS